MPDYKAPNIMINCFNKVRPRIDVFKLPKFPKNLTNVN